MLLHHGTDWTTWGPTPLALPKRVHFDEDGHGSRIDAVSRALERANPGLKVANYRHDVSEVARDGTVLSTHYELTLGKPLKTGGFSVRGRAWVAIRFLTKILPPRRKCPDPDPPAPH